MLSCTSLFDGLVGAAFHLAARISLTEAIAKTSPDRLGTYGHELGWHLRLVSSQNNTFNGEYHRETPKGDQLPVFRAVAVFP
jgi:predicted dithiol-disulfide oxidoreductase (DUF899 family)